MIHTGALIEAVGGEAFLHASIGEAGEKAFPPAADSSNDQKMSACCRVDSRLKSRLVYLLNDDS
jgi:hypothetical protein